tara:strand:- start:351 stop:713 length:363 start_codon:yes stop_codon:yes gene_type:complete
MRYYLFFYWEAFIPLINTPSRLIFGNTIGFRRNIYPRFESYLKGRKYNRIVSKEIKDSSNILKRDGFLGIVKFPEKITNSIISEFLRSVDDEKKCLTILNGRSIYIKNPFNRTPINHQFY